MNRKIQKRTHETRAKLVAVARSLIEKQGFEALRVEEVVKLAGVAKGTFFAHFKDKDRLLELLIGEALATELDKLEQIAPPRTVDGIIKALEPLHSYMTADRYAFDVILRYSGAAAIQEIGPIADTFYRYDQIVTSWFEKDHPFRQDVSASVLASGIQAFAVQSMSLNFCALSNTVAMTDRLQDFLVPWLIPGSAS